VAVKVVSPLLPKLVRHSGGQGRTGGEWRGKTLSEREIGSACGQGEGILPRLCRIRSVFCVVLKAKAITKMYLIPSTSGINFLLSSRNIRLGKESFSVVV
jgi:hypothetical protein